MIVPKRQKLAGRIADYLMLPVMYLLQGNFRELPQRTHRWNNTHLKNKSISDLKSEKIVFVDGDTDAERRWIGPIPLFHMPIFGGWKKFVVLEPTENVCEWFVGWVAFDVLGVSKILLNGAVRLGIGPRQAEFFGLTAAGKQIELSVIGEGKIGQAANFSKIPLL